jgi:hypothetical protein
MQELIYHHICIPTSVARHGEVHNPEYRLFSSGYFDSIHGLEWMRFESECPLPELIRTVPHIGFVVQDMETALADKEVLLGPLSPTSGVTTATIAYGGTSLVTTDSAALQL